MSSTEARTVAARRERAAGTTCDGDPRWRAWYERHARAIYGYIRFHVPSPDAAEDLTAETFLKAFRSSGRYDAERGGVRTWLLAIARNCVRDQRRRARRRAYPGAGLRDLVHAAPSPEERLLWEETVRRILNGVAELNERDREIIGLRYGSGLSTGAVAESLGLSESAVTTRLWRALDRLRDRLEATTT